MRRPYRPTRRSLIKNVGAAGLATGALGMWRPSRALAQDGPVTILGIVPLTGPYAADGERIMRGQQMAVESFGGQVAGRPINYITRDAANDAGAATRRATEAIESENAMAIVGPWADDVGQAISDVARRKKVIHYWSGGPIDCHRYWFQWAPPYYTGVKATMDYVLQKHPDAKRWYMLTSDYQFGWTMEELEKQIGAEKGIEFIGGARHVLGEREFARYMGEIMAAQPDVLVLNNFGLDTAQAIRTAFSYGLNEMAQIVVPWGSGIEDYIRLEPAMTEGLIVGTAFYYTTEHAADFAAEYIERYNEPPGYPAGSGFAALEALLRGIEKAGSSDPADVVNALEGMEFDSVVGPTSIDPDTHQTIRPFFVTEGKPVAERNGEFDVATIVATSSEMPPPEVLGCEDLGEL
ncbi:MAG TPA: ABC transporter substrate-binding protein [Paracoccaceae bacterium]|nr:ABC transporter substrate-binding protein [Paracoccaceae bacterium]